MEEEEINFFIKKANFFLKENLPAHIITKNGRFFNGWIKEVRADFLIINDLKFGEQILFFLEIKSIEKYAGEKEDENGRYNKN